MENKLVTFLMLSLLALLRVEAVSPNEEALPALSWIFEQSKEDELKLLLESEDTAIVLGLSKQPMVYDIKQKTLTTSKLDYNEFIKAYDLQSDSSSIKARWLVIRLKVTSDEERNTYRVDIGYSGCHGRFGTVIQDTRSLAIDQKSRLIVKCCF